MGTMNGFSIKRQNYALHVLFPKENDGKMASCLHSHVKSVYSVTKITALYRS